jgi:hypothetical protein
MFTKLKSKAYRQSYSEKQEMPPPSLYHLNASGGRCAGGWMHTYRH